jgi:glycosyltransferase involved in cell wall biosynthesis
VRYVYTLVCFSMYKHPEFYPAAIRMRLRALIGRGVRAATYLLCVSDNVRELYQEHFGIPRERMAVTYMAAGEQYRPLPRDEVRAYVEDQCDIRDPYLLFSGRWERRKNLDGTLRAFAQFKAETRLPHKLVLTGRRGWDAGDVLRTIAHLRLERDVVDVGKTPVAHLPYLYCGADALVYASLWEGFGMPIVEAMACGTPVITSNVSSMPEVAGGAALLVDPSRVDQIADAMRIVATSEETRRELRLRGLARARQFTWEQTARKTLAAYEAVGAA